MAPIVKTRLTSICVNVLHVLEPCKVARSGLQLDQICQGGHSEPHPNRIGPPGTLGFFILDSK